ncbi:MAG: hypothetical protein IT450_23035 [Phycisphaerales bacterium]|nr:hypothetical protein [Phycisphaerales bacterium]
MVRIAIDAEGTGEKVQRLPEFRVNLTRLRPGEQAYPKADSYDPCGQRTKLGGDPDYYNGDEPTPICPNCRAAMTFVAQIDSVEHDCECNPHKVDCLSDDQKWMLGDVGMIYVFFCFECWETRSVFRCA